jgi:hypothetical protein
MFVFSMALMNALHFKTNPNAPRVLSGRASLCATESLSKRASKQLVHFLLIRDHYAIAPFCCKQTFNLSPVIPGLTGDLIIVRP